MTEEQERLIRIQVLKEELEEDRANLTGMLSPEQKALFQKITEKESELELLIKIESLSSGMRLGEKSHDFLEPDE